MKNAVKRPKDELSDLNPNSTWLNPNITTLEQLKDWIILNLGGGLQTVELLKKHLNVIIGDSIQFYTKYEYHPEEYCIVNLSYYKPGIGIDLSELKIASIKQISFQKDNVLQGYGDLFFSPYAAFGQGVGSPMFGMGGQSNFVGSWVTFQNLHEWYDTAQRMMGSNPDWTYDECTGILKLMPEPRSGNQCILLTCNKQLPLSRYYGNEYVKRICLAKAKILLGLIRKKFQNVPLPGGGSIDTSIGDEGKAELDKIEEEIIKCESRGQFFCLS